MSTVLNSTLQNNFLILLLLLLLLLNAEYKLRNYNINFEEEKAIIVKGKYEWELKADFRFSFN